MVTSKKSDDVFLPHSSLTRGLKEGRFRMENDLIMMCYCSSEMLTWLEANCGAISDFKAAASIFVNIDVNVGNYLSRSIPSDISRTM